MAAFEFDRAHLRHRLISCVGHPPNIVKIRLILECLDAYSSLYSRAISNQRRSVGHRVFWIRKSSAVECECPVRNSPGSNQSRIRPDHIPEHIGGGRSTPSRARRIVFNESLIFSLYEVNPCIHCPVRLDGLYSGLAQGLLR